MFKETDNTAAVQKSIEDVCRREALVGVPEENAGREGSMSNAALAFIHNYGAGPIPPRPFMEPGIEAVRDQCLAILQGSISAALGQPNAQAIQEKGLQMVAAILQNSVQGKISAGLRPDLKPSTKRARDRKARKSYGKRAKGNEQFAGSYTPLVDTGKLAESIRGVVRDREA